MPWQIPQVWDVVARHLTLSPRERQVLAEILDDQTEQAVADELDISAHTVHTHLARIYQKLSVSSRTELVGRVWQCYAQLSADCDSGVPTLCDRRRRGECPHED
jgi:DNA-binding CsgD family transcriptional regulator